MTWSEITTVDELTGLLGEPTARARDKGRAALHELDRQWLAASPFCLLATTGGDVIATGGGGVITTAGGAGWGCGRV